MQIDGGFNVFAGKQSKFFPVDTNDKAAVAKTKAEAEAYHKTAGEKAFMQPAVRQIWFTTELISREHWADNWTETRRATRTPDTDEHGNRIKGDDGKEVWRETGDWLLFKSQWSGDDPALLDEHFGKKLWVWAVQKPHPDFDPQFPTRYTAQLDREASANGVDVFKVNDKGDPIPSFIRVVKEVLGTDAKEAKAWYEAKSAGNAPEAVSQLEEELIGLIPSTWGELGLSETDWVDVAKKLFSQFHEGAKVPSVAKEYDGVVDMATLVKVSALIKKYPPF
jgi:hypothetical protein